MEALTRAKVHFVVAKEIEKYIRVNNLQEGDQLPSEKQLTEMLNISRSSVREGIKLLEGVKMITAKQGKGIFVAATKSTTISIEVATDTKSLLDVLAIREVLEVQAVTLAIQKGSQEELLKIGEKYKLMKQCFDDGKDAATLDYDFHVAVYEAGHNTYLKNLIESISYIFLNAWKDAISVPSVFAETLPYHGALTDALLTKDTQKAIAAIKTILSYSEKAIERGL